MDDLDPLAKVIVSYRDELELEQQRSRKLERSNKIAAIVADTCMEYTESVTDQLGEDSVPVNVVREMFAGVLAALAGSTDPARLNLHPQATPAAWARVQCLLGE